jgi:hypothetical protein
MQPIASVASALPAHEAQLPAEGDEAVILLEIIISVSNGVHVQASSAAGSEVRRRRRRAKAASSDAAVTGPQPDDSAAGVVISSDAANSQSPIVEASASASAVPISPPAPVATHSSSGPALRAGGGVRAQGRSALASSRVSALVEDADVVGEIIASSQSGGRFLSGAVESGDSVLKRSVFKEMPLDGALPV